MKTVGPWPLKFEEGQYVYHVTTELIGKKHIMKRQVLLKWDLVGNRYDVGDSKQRESSCSSGPISGGVYFYPTPKEAKQAYIKRQMEWNKRNIRELREQIKRLQEERTNILKLRHSKLRVDGFPDDYTPCDY